MLISSFSLFGQTSHRTPAKSLRAGQEAFYVLAPTQFVCLFGQTCHRAQVKSLRAALKACYVFQPSSMFFTKQPLIVIVFSLFVIFFYLRIMGFIKSYKIAQIPASLSFANRTCLITGATSGLGFETAVHYVKLGAVKVYITARTVTKGRAAREAIEARTGRTGVVEILTLDMDDFAGVTTFMDILKRDIKALDIILLNAGLMTWDHEISPDGWEKTIQVDALSTVLLALLLLPWLKTVKQDGVVQHLGIVGSGGHTSIDISSPEFPKKDILTFYSKKNNFQGGKPQYDVSKLFLHYAAPEIAKLAVDSDGR